jgi:hypothetical protein
MENIAVPDKKPPVSPDTKPKPPSRKGGGGVSLVFNKIYRFFTNKWTKLGFSFVSAGYLWFLGWVATLTFNYYFVFENAAAVFFMYTFINVMFVIVMIYTRRSFITRMVTLFMHPFVIVMLVYGFGNWYLLLPVFVAATVIFFASGANESLKVILGTIYMIMFVLVYLAYVTLQSLTIPIPFKMDLDLRVTQVVDESELRDSPQFRVVAYVDPETKARRTAQFHIEPIGEDKALWNMTAEKINRERAATADYGRVIDPEGDFELKWISPNIISIDGKHIRVSDEGEMTVINTAEPVDPPVTTGEITTSGEGDQTTPAD